jgi:hypothetical protein
VDAPTFSQHGGVIPSTTGLTLTAPQGTIYYTIDGSDPRLGSGEVSANAVAYADALNLAENTTIKARALHDGEWSALNEASFAIASEAPLRITEINYNPHAANPIEGMQERDDGNDQFEFIELKNVGDELINLGGVQLVRATVDGDEGEGIAFTFGAQTLAPGQHLVVVRDREAFQSRYGSAVRIATGTDGEGGDDGEYGGRLSDGGEVLTLADAGGKYIQQFRYSVRDPWPTRANGLGSSLQVIDTAGSYSDASNWQASSDFGGSPGDVGQAIEQQIVLNEVLANPIAPQTVMVELHNTTNQDVEVTNWYLSNSNEDYFQTKITEAATVPAGGYHALSVPDLPLDGARGDQIWLVAADASGKPLAFADFIQFGTSLAGVSLGPSSADPESFVQLAAPTFGGENVGPRVNEVVISEVSYFPVDPDGPGGTFRSSTDATVFRFTVGMDQNARLIGERIRATLDDTSGEVYLYRPGGGAEDDPSLTPLVYVDGVSYLSTAPWPENAAGTGNSLNRTLPSDAGDLPSSWTGALPSPGAVDFVVRHPGDANEDGQFDQLDITMVLQANKYLTDQPATWSEGDWNGDGRFDQLDLVEALKSGSYMQGPLAARLTSDETSAVDTALEQLG